MSDSESDCNREEGELTRPMGDLSENEDQPVVVSLTKETPKPKRTILDVTGPEDIQIVVTDDRRMVSLSQKGGSSRETKRARREASPVRSTSERSRSKSEPRRQRSSRTGSIHWDRYRPSYSGSRSSGSSDWRPSTGELTRLYNLARLWATNPDSLTLDNFLSRTRLASDTPSKVKAQLRAVLSVTHPRTGSRSPKDREEPKSPSESKSPQETTRTSETLCSICFLEVPEEDVRPWVVCGHPLCADCDKSYKGLAKERTRHRSCPVCNQEDVILMTENNHNKSQEELDIYTYVGEEADFVFKSHEENCLCEECLAADEIITCGSVPDVCKEIVVE